MARRLETTAARIRDSEDEVFGDLRVTTTMGFGTLWLAPRLPRLFERYPNLRLELMLEERILDLPMREADVAIRMKEPSQADLIAPAHGGAHPLLRQPRLSRAGGIAAAAGGPRTHRLIVQSAASHQVRAGAEFVKSVLAHAGSSLTVNTYFGILQGVIHGLGIGSLPDYVTAGYPDLVEGLPRPRERGDPRLPRLRRGAAPLETRVRLPGLRARRDQRP
jgi:DNA-binding transcriptional LysR family regulator